MIFQIKRQKQYGILLAILFAIGILGNFTVGNANLPAAPQSAAKENGLPYGAAVQREEPPEAISKAFRDAGFCAARTLQDIDDFQIASDSGNAGTDARQQHRTAQLLLFAASECDTGAPALPGRLWEEEKRILLFHVIAFIHRTDGKKKTCFAV